MAIVLKKGCKDMWVQAGHSVEEGILATEIRQEMVDSLDKNAEVVVYLNNFECRAYRKSYVGYTEKRIVNNKSKLWTQASIRTV